MMFYSYSVPTVPTACSDVTSSLLGVWACGIKVCSNDGSPCIISEIIANK